MEKLLENLEQGFRGQILRQEPMSNHTSWKLGGPAELFIVPQNRTDLQLALRAICKQRLPWIVIGNGSNMLVSDQGLAGVVISLAEMTEINLLPGEKVEVEAGVLLEKLVKTCCRAGLGGIEELSGIPGMVGGALLMNAGAYTTEIGDLVNQVYLTDGHGEWALRRDQINFGYRSSGLENRGVISGATLQLRKAEVSQLEARCQKLLERRKEVQKIKGAHAGSVFKNPPDKKAWELIQDAGLRGVCHGKAEISPDHCNHIVNRGGAKASDVMHLIEKVQKEVEAKSGIRLELEIRLAGWEAQGQ